MNEEPRTPDHSSDDVARLLRLAGGRTAVPTERANRVRAAAMQEWRQGLTGRSRTRSYLLAAALATAACLVVLFAYSVWPIFTPTSDRIAMNVETVVGAAWVRTDHDGQQTGLRPVGIGDRVPTGAALVTGEDGGASIRLESGHSVRLAPDTSIERSSDGRLRLRQGTIYVDSGSSRSATSGLVVQTDFGDFREIGTQFEVRVDRLSARVRLREGAVILRREDREIRVGAGNELTVNREGEIDQREIEVYGPEWAWWERITPMIELEGRTARSFLQWVARENGWRLAFGDEYVARQADEIVLGGTPDRLTLHEALDVVLPTCGMRHRVEDGLLIVSADRSD